MRYRGRGYSNAQLTEMSAAIEADPGNQTPGLYRFTPGARKKLDEIARAITDNLAEARRLAGDPVPTCGYSGRQSNRR